MSLLLLIDEDVATAFTPASPVAERYARMMQQLLPPGRIWKLIGTFLADLFLGCADELARVEGRVNDMLNEADPSTATELLPEYESELDLETAATVEERRARIVARLIARQRFRPVDFQTALAPLLALDPVDVVVIERTHAFAVSLGDDREIFRFFIYRNPALPGTYFLASAQALVDKIKPSHTVGAVIESVSFLCEDPHDECERDLLGV